MVNEPEKIQNIRGTTLMDARKILLFLVLFCGAFQTQNIP